MTTTQIAAAKTLTVTMPIDLNEEDGGKLTVFHMTGKLNKDDYSSLSSQFERLSAHGGHLRVLLDMKGFEGWASEDFWSELKADLKHNSEIERLAAIGDKKWENGLVDFSRPFTSAIVRYFDFSEADEAHQWLLEK